MEPGDWARHMRDLTHKLALTSVLLLGLIQGALYANLLPPWSMFDEPQHYHYIQHLVEHGTAPVAGESFLSTAIVESLFETNHWEIFHMPPPPSSSPDGVGFIGNSYEGYQPPLAYALLIPVYTALPVSALTKLYAFRWIMVGISLVTLWIAWRIVLELFPGSTGLAASASLLLALLPERVAAVSRLSNDVLLELIAAAFVWLCTRAILRGMSTRRSQLLGLLLGLGMATKISMLFVAVLLLFVYLLNRRTSRLGLHLLWTGAIALALVAPLAARNLVLYGDLGGFSGFEVVYDIPPPARDWSTLGSAVWDLFRHTWVVWWKGGEAQGNPLLTGVYILLLGVCAASALGLVRFWRSGRVEGRLALQNWVLVAYACAGVTFALAVLTSYFTGLFPIIQGRFYLPVMAPLAILFTRGLESLPRRTILLAGTLLILAGLNALALFGNLLPYYYFWSAEAAQAGIGSYSWQTLREVWAISYPRWLSDKPAFVRTMSALLLPAYALAAALAATAYARVRTTHKLHAPTLDGRADLVR